jgi:hypothetical protein
VDFDQRPLAKMPVEDLTQGSSDSIADHFIVVPRPRGQISKRPLDGFAQNGGGRFGNRRFDDSDHTDRGGRNEAALVIEHNGGDGCAVVGHAPAILQCSAFERQQTFAVAG